MSELNKGEIMQVQSIQSNNYNNNKRRNPNFTSIKKIDYSGLYEKAPEEGKKLLDAFRQNPYAMDFCRRYDVKIFFHAMKSGWNNVESSIHIFYDNPTVGKLKKFWRTLNSSEEQVKIHSWKTNLKESTSELAEMILPEIEGVHNSPRGLLNSHIKLADESMQKVLDEKTAKKLAKQAQKQGESRAQNQLLQEKRELEKLTDSLIECTK